MDSFTWTGRVRKPWYKKINPIWWLLNDDNQTVDQAAWYHPEWPQWRRWWTWNTVRNPFQNLRSFVLGVQDRNYTVTGRFPVLTTQRDDLRPVEYGWHYAVCWTMLPRPFASYSGKSWVFQFGWQPNGFFAFIKINRHES